MKAVAEAASNQCDGERAERGRRPHRRRGQADQRHRGADQPSGAQCHDRSRARGRSRSRLCRRRRRSEGAGRPDCESDRRDHRRRSRRCNRRPSARSRRRARSNARSAKSATFPARSPRPSREQGAATQEIARCVETASKRTSEAAEQVNGVNQVAETTNRHATSARGVADNLGTVASRIREQVDRFFQRLNAACNLHVACSRTRPRCDAASAAARPGSRRTACRVAHRRHDRRARSRRPTRCAACWRGVTE